MGAAIALLVLSGLWAFWPVSGHQFIQFDDQLYIVGNPHVRAGLNLRDLAWALRTSYASNWHPLTWLSHQLDVQVFGLDPGRHHLVSLGLHLATAAGLLLVIFRMTGRLGRSALVAGLFALHPLHVESVAWASERKDVLSAFFWVATMGAYVRYARSPGWGRYLGVSVLFGLGLAAKPMLVTLPLVLLLLDYWPLGRWGATRSAGGARGARRAAVHLCLEKVPLLALSAAAAAATLWAQHAAGAVYPLAMLPFEARLANAAVALVRYLGKMFVPVQLSYFYPLRAAGPAWWQVGAAVLLLAALCVLAVRLRGRHPYLVAGWLWYCVTLVPVVGLVQVGTQAMADRYTYLPLTGVFLALVWWLGSHAGGRSPALRLAAAGAAVLVLAACAVMTRVQVGFWRDTRTLAGHALTLDPDNWLAHNDLGIALAQQGRLAESVAALERSIALYPGYDAAHNNLGVVLLRLGRLEKAVPLFDETIRLNPAYREAYQNRGVAMIALGRIDEAAVDFQQLLVVDPGSPEAHKNLGYIELVRGRTGEAAAHYRSALKLRPEVPESHNNLGVALMRLGRPEESLARYRKALELRPGYAEAEANLSEALLMLGAARRE